MRKATRSEKLAAFDTLEAGDYGKLLKAAEFTARKFRGRVNDADAEDLLHEAILRVLDERNTRAWCPQKVDFLTFLRGCIRSIASDWYKRAKHTESPDNLLSPTNYHAQIEAAIIIEKIRMMLSERPHAVDIFDLKCFGLTAREIQERLGISGQIYGAAVKWIDRSLKQGGFRR